MRKRWIVGHGKRWKVGHEDGGNESSWVFSDKPDWMPAYDRWLTKDNGFYVRPQFKSEHLGRRIKQIVSLESPIAMFLLEILDEEGKNL